MYTLNVLQIKMYVHLSNTPIAGMRSTELVNEILWSEETFSPSLMSLKSKSSLLNMAVDLEQVQKPSCVTQYNS